MQGIVQTISGKKASKGKSASVPSTQSIMQAQLARPKYTKDEIVHWINQFKHGDVDDVDYQRRIIDIFINSIRVYDKKLLITYNYKEGTETIPIADIEAALSSDLTGRAPPKPLQRKGFLMR